MQKRACGDCMLAPVAMHADLPGELEAAELYVEGGNDGRRVSAAHQGSRDCGVVDPVDRRRIPHARVDPFPPARVHAPGLVRITPRTRDGLGRAADRRVVGDCDLQDVSLAGRRRGGLADAVVTAAGETMSDAELLQAASLCYSSSGN